MPDIALLKKTLTPGETLGLDTLDPRFQEIASLAEQGEFMQSADKTEEVLREDIYDIRLIGYYLYGCFLKDGLPGLIEILEVAKGLFGESWAAIGPTKKKENHAQNGMAWFFSKLLERLKYDEEKKSPEWKVWIQKVTADDAARMIELIGEFRGTMSAVVPNAPKVYDMLPKVADWATSFQKMVYVAPPPEPEPAPEAAPATEAAPADAGGDAFAGGPAPAGGSMMMGGGAVPTFPVVEGSFMLKELIARLEAFDTLVQRGEIAKAAILSSDVLNAIEKFDPRAYFPKLFSAFYSRLAPNVQKLAPWWERKDSMGWQALEQLYKVDIQAFVRSREVDAQDMLGMAASGASGGGGSGGGNGGGGGGGGGEAAPAPAFSDEPAPAFS